MARKLKAEAESPKEKTVVSRGVLEGLIKSIVAKKLRRRESNGEAGKATQMCADQTGYSLKVVTLLASMYRMEDAKRTSFVTDLLSGLNTLGFADEGTLFTRRANKQRQLRSRRRMRRSARRTARRSRPASSRRPTTSSKTTRNRRSLRAAIVRSIRRWLRR